MSSYELTPLASADVFEIWAYIAEDNGEAANRVEQAIREACTFVAHAPLRGLYTIRPHTEARAILDGFAVSQLLGGLQARDQPRSNRRRAAWQAETSAIRKPRCARSMKRWQSFGRGCHRITHILATPLDGARTFSAAYPSLLEIATIELTS